MNKNEGDILFEGKVFNSLVDRYHEKKLSHAFLLETNDEKKCLSDLYKFIKTISCPQDYCEDCHLEGCSICNLIDTDNLPSLIRVDPDGVQIKRSQIQEVLNRFQSKPIFANYNIYIINECDKLNTTSANSLLKFIEEPEDDIIGFFVTTNKMNVLSTIRSRCQEINVYYQKVGEDFIYLDRIVSYLNNVYKNDDAILFNKNEGILFFKERVEWICFFQEMLLVLYSYLKNANNDYDIQFLKDTDHSKLANFVTFVETILKYLQSNGNIELILDKFVIEMRNYYA